MERSEVIRKTYVIIQPMSHYFYLARCADGSLYCGSCIDLSAREARHNEGKGAKYTRSRRPIHIIYHEELSTLADARRREAQVKSWSKIEKESLVMGKHPIKICESRTHQQN